MGLGNDAMKVDSWDVKKSKGRKKKKNGGDGDDGVKETGCCISLRIIGCCVTSRSKVDSSVSSISTHGIVFICNLLIIFLMFSCLLNLNPQFN